MMQIKIRLKDEAISAQGRSGTTSSNVRWPHVTEDSNYVIPKGDFGNHSAGYTRRSCLCGWER
jgi:hypothetical protein